MKRLATRISIKFKALVIGLLTILLVVACQGDQVRQPANLQSSSNCRTVHHALGEVCVPETSSRLVSLDNITLADAAALGVLSTGIAISDDEQIDYLGEYLENYDQMEKVGQSTQPHLEKILKLKPDLIMGLEQNGESIFSQLSQIAPTAVGEWVGDPSWRKYFNFVARVLGKEEQAKQVWGRYEQRITDIQAALGNQLEDMEVSTVYGWQGIYINTNASCIGSILADIGIHQPAYAENPSNGTITLSEEAILDIDADTLFISVYNNARSKEVLAEWQRHPLWQKLKAVQNGRAYVVNGNIG